MLALNLENDQLQAKIIQQFYLISSWAFFDIINKVSCAGSGFNSPILNMKFYCVCNRSVNPVIYDKEAKHMKSSFLQKWQTFQFHNGVLLQSVHFSLQPSSEMDSVFQEHTQLLSLPKTAKHIPMAHLGNHIKLYKLSIL